MSSPGDSMDAEDSYVTTVDPADDERPSAVIVTAVASVLERDPLELAPLYETVDPDALDSLFQHAHRTDDAGTHEVWFTYEGVDIGVRSDGEIRVDVAANSPS
ncbi:HalOD1 output domain-containing protein [Natrarchaeobius sp. A-rgal3]|uniref:HalOD1 output domain-containing protein n=1 Tax=Natrarchaeobius versutus TaxID=1679078 RepID=UPI00350F12C6